MLERRRWWRETGLPALRVLAIEHWDPLNVYDDAMQAHVYDPYLERLGRMLRHGKGPAEIARYLAAVRTKAFHRDENDFVDEEFADRVIAWYQVEAPR
jgi:hypothetical protein